MEKHTFRQPAGHGKTFQAILLFFAVAFIASFQMGCGGGSLKGSNPAPAPTPSNPAPTAQMTAAPASVNAGQPVTLTWSTTNATSVTIDNGVGTVAASGSTTVKPSSSVTYTLTATGSGGTVTTTAAVTVTAPAPGAPTATLSANPTTINAGQSTTLSWTTTNATSIAIDNGVGQNLPASGSASASPSVTTTYTLTATGPGGTTTATTSVTVNPAPTAQDITAVGHIIYMLQENRSFDSYFGDLGAYRQANGFGLASDIDGRPANASNKADDGAVIPAFHFKSSCIENLTPDWRESHGDYNLGDPGSNVFLGNGFVSNGGGLARFEATHYPVVFSEFSSVDGQNPQSLPASGSMQIMPPVTTNVYLFAKNGSTQGEALASILIQVPNGAPMPAGEVPNAAGISSPGVTFTADQTTVQKGTVVTLTWNIPGAAGALIGTWYDLHGERAMGFYNDQDLPYYYFMASEFGTSDRWFSPLSSNSEPNRTYILSATTHGHVHDPGSYCSDQSACPGSTNVVKNIFQLLDAAGITWKVYYQKIDKTTGLPSTRLSRYQPFEKNHLDHVVPDSQFFIDLQNGTLPQVAYLEENSGLDEHPGGTSAGDVNSGNNIQSGEKFMAKHINALMASSAWKDSVFFLTWDEGGGLYDHVAPQPAVSPDNIPPMDLIPGKDTNIHPLPDFTRTGFRVPLIVISPFANKSFVSHTVRDYTAVLKFIEMRFNLPNLTARDKVQPDMLEFFNFAAPPWETPPTPPDLTNQKTLPCNFTQFR